MTQNLGERLNVKVRDFYRSYRKRMPYFMEFDLWKIIPLEKSGEILAIGSRLCWFALAGQEIMIRILAYVFLDNITKQRWKRDRSYRAFGFGRTDADIRFTFAFVVDTLHRAIDSNRIFGQRDVAHLKSAQFSDPNACQ